jgi:hypothetical protein
MSYPHEINSMISITKNPIDHDVADCEGFDVVSSDATKYTMVRRRPSNVKLAGQAEFLASLARSRIAEAEAAIRTL